MRVLVTGAGGLYGVHMIDTLAKREDVIKVIGVDNFSRDYMEKNPFSLIESQEFKNKFELLRMDFRELDAERLNQLDVDVVIHFAAYVSIPDSMEYPDKYFEVNELGTFKFLQNLLKTKNQPYFIYASSPEIYGTAIRVPMDVDHPVYPRSIYAVTKLSAEKHCHVLYQWYRYPVAIMRNFNTYGENQNVWGYAAVISNFITQALRGDPLIVHGDGKQTRDFMYVKDAVRAYSLLIDKRERCKGEIFNLGTGKQTSIIELAEKIKDLTHSESKITFQQSRRADLLALCADISRTKEKLGWTPECTLEEGLKRTIKWYERHMK